MGFYDSAYKNIGNQVSYAAATVGAYMFQRFNKEKATAANDNATKDVQMSKEQMDNYHDRISTLESQIEEKNKELAVHRKGLNDVTNAIRGLLK